MGANIKIERNFSLTELDLLTERDMRDLGEYAVRTMRTRTEAEKSVDGGGFRPYSERYAKKKRADLGHSRVDLTYTGAMLNNMRVTDVTATPTSKSVHIAFTTADAARKAVVNDPSRPFFGLNEAEAQQMTDVLEAALERRLSTGQE